MAFPNVDRFCLYNLAVKYCQEVLELSGPQYYLNLFQSLLNNVQFASSFKYFTNEDAYNFFLCYPQIFKINDSFVFLNIQPHMDIQQSINIQNNLSNFIFKIRKEQTKVSCTGLSDQSQKVGVNKIYKDIHKNFSSAVSEITEIPQSIKKDLVYSILFLLRSFQPLNLKCAFKTVLFIVKNASSNFLDLSKTNKQLFIKAMCKVLKAKLPGKFGKFSPSITFKNSVLLFATYLITERRKINFQIFLNSWKKLNIYPHIPNHVILKVLKTSEFIVMNRRYLLSLSPSFEPVNLIVESYSKLILPTSPCENWNLNPNEQDFHNRNAVGVDCDVQSTDPSYEEQNVFNCTKALCEVQMLGSQSNQEEKPKSIKKEQDLSHPMRVSKADNNVETTPFEKIENEQEASEKSQMTDKNFLFDENAEKLLNYSFIIRRYFNDALPDHIVLSLVLTSENVCENFVILSKEDQFDFVERCCNSIIANDSSPSDNNYHKLKKSTLVEERVVIICYLVVKLGGIRYGNLIELLKKTGIYVQDYEEYAFIQACIEKRYFLNISNYIKFSKKRFLTLKAPFKGIKFSLKHKYALSFPSNHAPSYACSNNSFCFQTPNESQNISPEMFPSSSGNFHNLSKDSTKFKVNETAENEAYSDQKMFNVEDLLSSQSKQEDKQKSVKKEQDSTHSRRMSKADNIVETSPLKNTENKLEENQNTDKKFSFGENVKKILDYSFIIIRRYFEDALPHHIVLSFLLASENVCENFAVLSIEDQFDFIERCCDSIIAYDSSPCDRNYHELKKSTLVEERVLIICYLVVKSGHICYINVVKLLKEKGICVHDFEKNALIQACIPRSYFENISNYINFTKKKGYLTLRPPFSDIRRCLKQKYVSNYDPGYNSPNNSSFQISNENKNISPEIFPSSSRDPHNLSKDSLKIEVNETAEKEAYSNQKMFNAEDLLSSQCKLEDKQMPIKKEQDLTPPMRVSKADNVVETSSLKKTEIKLEAPEKTEISDKKFSFDENMGKLLECSFFIIRRYFKNALPHHIVLSFLLASENVCENFAILSKEDQCDFLERCYCSINAYDSSPSDIYYHELKKNTLVEERVLIICYLVIKSGGIHYTDLIKLLKKTGLCVQVCEDSAFVQARIYFQNICNYINFSKKGFLILKPPFSGLKRSLRNMDVSAFSPNYVPSHARLDNSSLGFQIPNKTLSPEKLPSSSCSPQYYKQLSSIL